jgi:hypothetical protein
MRLARYGRRASKHSRQIGLGLVSACGAGHIVGWTELARTFLNEPSIAHVLSEKLDSDKADVRRRASPEPSSACAKSRPQRTQR